MLRVTVTKDGALLQRADFRKDEIIIGRGGDADVHIPAEAVSRRHARLTRTKEGWQVADVGAANGVYVSRQRGNPERVVIHRLGSGDRIHIEHFILELEDVDESQAPVYERSGEGEPEEEDMATRRTQFISMVDVLRAKEELEAEKRRAAEPRARPADRAKVEVEATWWVRLASATGHRRTFIIEKALAKVGTAAACDVRLPDGPGFIVELERLGPSVTLRRIGMWPFPRVHVEGRAVKEALLSDRDGFTVGDFEVNVFLKRAPG